MNKLKYLGLNCFFAVMCLHTSAIAQGKSCRFLDVDFEDIAGQALVSDPWAIEKVLHFIADEGSSASRLLLNQEEVVCVDFQTLDEAQGLRKLANKSTSTGPLPVNVWRQFTSALRGLTCDRINSNGRRVQCPDSRSRNFVAAARQAAIGATNYDPSYVDLTSIGADIPATKGVCSDVVVRALRTFNVDLKKLIQEDIVARSKLYALRKNWNQERPDSNIDHRRVANLLIFLTNDHERFIDLKDLESDWLPGDIVIWNLLTSPRLLYHIGVVSDQKGESGHWKVIHHLPPAGSEDDRLYDWEILAHVRPLL